MDDISKEKIKTSLEDLSPTLQGMIASKQDKQSFTILNNKVLEINSNLNDITVTIGPDRPDNVAECKNLNLNTQVNILETYHNSAWNRHALTFK